MFTRRMIQKYWMPIYRMWVFWRIRQTQECRLAGLRLEIPTGVFHPKYFFSTSIFIDFLAKQDWKDKQVLDVGTGSGALALFAARLGAQAYALDINPRAVLTAQKNAVKNKLPLKVWASNLMEALPHHLRFDTVLINPPYYPKTARNPAEMAFYAGEHFEFFQQLFAQLPAFCLPDTRVWMILSEDCHWQQILAIATTQGWHLKIVFEKKKWGEQLFVAAAERINFAL